MCSGYSILFRAIIASDSPSHKHWSAAGNTNNSLNRGGKKKTPKLNLRHKTTRLKMNRRDEHLCWIVWILCVFLGIDLIWWWQRMCEAKGGWVFQTPLYFNLLSPLASPPLSPPRHSDATSGKHWCQTSPFPPDLAPDGSIENTCVFTVCLLTAWLLMDSLMIVKHLLRK